MMRFDILGFDKSGITYAFSHNYAEIKIDSDDDLLLEKKHCLSIML